MFHSKWINKSLKEVKDLKQALKCAWYKQTSLKAYKIDFDFFLLSLENFAKTTSCYQWKQLFEKVRQNDS